MNICITHLPFCPVEVCEGHLCWHSGEYRNVDLDWETLKENLKIWAQPFSEYLEVALTWQSLWACWNAWTVARWPRGRPTACRPSWGSPRTWPQWPWTACCWPLLQPSYQGLEVCLVHLTGIQPRSHQSLEVGVGLAFVQPKQFQHHNI